MPDESVVPLIPPFASTTSIPPQPPYSKPPTMDHLRAGDSGRRKGRAWVVYLSYAFDWIVLAAAAAIGYVLGAVTPNKRPFSLTDPDISFPFTEHETVPAWLAGVINTLGPIVIIAIICLIFVPGSTVPRGTPQSLIWKRKLWELHTGWLGLALSVVSAWLITNGMKNMFGKPRPDLLARCHADIDNIAKYIVGGYNNFSANGQLVRAEICTNPDKAILDDGFRSYPSGHSSSSAAGLIYLSLFIASKFAIVIPFFTPGLEAASFAAFPSRTRIGVEKSTGESYELQSRAPLEATPSPGDAFQKQMVQHRRSVAAVRRQAAAPPLYLLLIAILPFFVAVFIASSRWFDFRHHGFDILFGFLIGTVTAFFAFYYYHLPISQGAGWAWGPRSADKAFWAGVGSASYATHREKSSYHYGDVEEGVTAMDYPFPRSTGAGTGLGHAGSPPSVRKAPTQEEPDMDTTYRGAAQE